MKKDFIVRRSITTIEGKPHVETYSEQELDRCKNCRHRPKREREDATGFALEFPDNQCPCQCDDGWYSWYPPDNWYCPIGER